MAFSQVPTDWVAGWSEDGTNVEVPIASFPQLTAAEADGATGDIRKIAYAILHKLEAAYAAKAVADRPTKMVVTKSESLNPGANQITVSFNVQFVLAIAAADVAAES